MAGTTTGMKAVINGENIDLIIFQGLTVNKIITWKDASGAAINLAGYSAKLQVREAADSELVTEFTTENNRIEIDAAPGRIILKMAAADSAELPLISGVYDLRVTDAGGAVYQLISGGFRVEAEVSQ